MARPAMAPAKFLAFAIFSRLLDSDQAIKYTMPCIQLMKMQV